MHICRTSYDAMKVLPEFWEGLPNVYRKSVFIKPNLVNPDHPWDMNSTTRVEVIRLIIDRLRQDRPKEIIVGDCGFKRQWETTINSTGYASLLDYPEVKLVGLQEGENFHRFSLIRIAENKYLSLFGAKLSDYVLNADVVINVPKLKVHNMAIVTGAVKNMMGCMAQKGSMHPNGSIEILHKRLRDLWLITKEIVNFNVMDGIMGAQYAEQSGVGRPSGVLISSTCQWSMDVAASRLMGIPPEKVPYLALIQLELNRGMRFIQVPDEMIQPYERPIRWRNL